MRAWKLLRQRKNGSLGPLFIGRRQVIPIGVPLEAECKPTKGFAVRKGWHCTLQPYAPHLSTRGRVWREVEVEELELYQRPESQGGTWVLAQRMTVLG